jgi:hypothetical protein
VPIITEGVAAAARTPPVAGERRRPGRRKFVSPWLIPLLRGQTGAWEGPVRETPPARVIEHDLLDRPGLGPLAFRGIAIAVLFAIPLWAALGLIVDWIITAH